MQPPLTEVSVTLQPHLDKCFRIYSVEVKVGDVSVDLFSGRLPRGELGQRGAQCRRPYRLAKILNIALAGALLDQARAISSDENGGDESARHPAQTIDELEPVVAIEMVISKDDVNAGHVGREGGQSLCTTTSHDDARFP